VKIVDIAVFMIIFNALFGLITALPMYGGVEITVESNIENYNASEAVSSLYQKILVAIGNETANETASLGFLGQIIKVPLSFFQGAMNFIYQVAGSLDLLVKVLKACFLTGQYLKDLVPIIPDSFANVITTIVNVVYILGIIQFVRGVGFTNMD